MCTLLCCTKITRKTQFSFRPTIDFLVFQNVDDAIVDGTRGIFARNWSQQIEHRLIMS